MGTIYLYILINFYNRKNDKKRRLTRCPKIEEDE